METTTKYLLGAAAVGALAYLVFKKPEVPVAVAPPPPARPLPPPPPPPPSPKVTPIPGLGISVPFSPDRPEVQAVLNTLGTSPEALAAQHAATSSPEGQAVANVLKNIPGFSF